MSEEQLEAALAQVERAPAGTEIHVSGHGETTFHPRWREVCRRVLELGHQPLIITNLARDLADDEIDLLAQFRTIQVSLDSDDEAMMRRIRRAVSHNSTTRSIRDFSAEETARARALFGQALTVLDRANATYDLAGGLVASDGRALGQRRPTRRLLGSRARAGARRLLNRLS